MIEAAWSESFKRGYNKRVKSNPILKKKFWQRIDLFLSDPFSVQLKTHKLGGKLLAFGRSALMMIAELFLNSPMMARHYLLTSGNTKRFIKKVRI